ncbi:HpcH/HpaI aldolase/citrate lyase family protein [Herbaspirillum sp. GCM10030257]|uniref:HpcH/HpaI aldolase/citrate lyase family protein n=1 Tax=Herbaspirillum sp. GCM10030257 TaxID=3273393 RepID=UPI00361B2C41
MIKNIPRSYLFVPANRPERFDKAVSSGAHAIIVDLEDAVPLSEKTTARAAVARWLRADRQVLIRINGADTQSFRDDLELCRLPGVAGVILPKAERIDDIFLVECAAATKTILPLIETAQGIANARVLAQARCVQRLMFGSIDFRLDLGIDGDGEELLHFRSQLVLASRIANILPPVDGVTTAINDQVQIEADTMRARRLGFGGKFCIHPSQVATVNRGFSPTTDDIEWAKRVIKLSGATDGAALAMDGEMVDRPVILKAQQILEESTRSTIESIAEAGNQH